MNAPLIISGPSGIGKSYLAKHLSLNYGCMRVVPTTTRQMRPGEVDGRDYQFLTDTEYQALRDQKALFTDNEFFGAKYGFTWDSVERISSRGLTPLFEIYVPKIYQFFDAFPEARTVFLMPHSEQQLANNMKQRGESEETVAKRILEGRKEVHLYLTEFYSAYQRCYQYSEESFKEVVADLTTTLIPEGRLVLEGRHAMYAR